jgi:hypothetical protein
MEQTTYRCTAASIGATFNKRPPRMHPRRARTQDTAPIGQYHRRLAYVVYTFINLTTIPLQLEARTNVQTRCFRTTVRCWSKHPASPPR